MEGIIALDIDGTIIEGNQDIPSEVVEFLSRCAHEGWVITFITGRTYTSGFQTLKNLPFPYYFAVQNGSILLEMPSKKVIAKNYLDQSILPKIQTLCSQQEIGFVVYTGFEHHDQCFFRSDLFPTAVLEYTVRRRHFHQEYWEDLGSFDALKISSFPSVKCFSKEGVAFRLAEAVENELGVHAPPVKDPFLEEGYYVTQLTSSQVSKGKILQALIRHLDHEGPVIVAGDDNNDRSMMEVAKTCVVMATAPQDMLDNADVIAPPASEKGIISGVEEAMKIVC